MFVWFALDLLCVSLTEDHDKESNAESSFSALYDTAKPRMNENLFFVIERNQIIRFIGQPPIPVLAVVVPLFGFASRIA